MPVGGVATIWKTGSAAVPGTLDDYTDQTKSVGMTLNGEKLDDTTFASTFRQYLGTYLNGTFTVKYRYSAALAKELLDQAISREPVDFEYAPNGDDTNDLKLTGSILIENYSGLVAVAQVEDIDITYSLTGDLTPALYT
jgi:hypothetical protein